jgi:hypothetical protein
VKLCSLLVAASGCGLVLTIMGNWLLLSVEPQIEKTIHHHYTICLSIACQTRLSHYCWNVARLDFSVAHESIYSANYETTMRVCAQLLC